MASLSMGTTLVKKKSGSEGSDTTIADLNSIGGINIEAADVDVTTLGSEDNFREFIQGLKDAGEIAFGGIVKSEAQIGIMLGLLTSGSLESWVVNYPSGAKWEFTAYVKSFGDTEKDTNDTSINFEGSLKISGKPTFTASGASV
jgi:hypothetical protein